MRSKYPVITLCGSAKFKDEFIDLERELTVDGNIVISLGLFGHPGDEKVWSDMGERTQKETKLMLGDMHRQKIDMADEVFIVNPDGYIGESTWSEICYATMIDKKLRFLSNVDYNEIDSRVENHINKAEELAYKQYEMLLLRAGLTTNVENMLKGMVTLDKRNSHIVDPWVPEEVGTVVINYPYPGHGDKDKGYDPFDVYGKKKMAKFVEEIISLEGLD